MAIPAAMGLLKFIDIGANLVDAMYSGKYHDSKKHEPDLNNVLERSWNAGLDKIIITGTSLKDSAQAVQLAKSDARLFCSVGCHPTNCSEISSSENAQSYLASMISLIESNREKVAAIGEFGLDYDRLHFCPKDVQLKYFEEQLVQFSPLGLPLFLHCRNAADDFLHILTKHRALWTSGVVHSFDGTEEQAQSFLHLGLYIGINGCSLKTEENLKVVKSLPNDRLLLETDSPWCEVRPSHPGFKFIKTKFPSVKKEKWEPDKMVKGRNEPATIRQVLEIVAEIKGMDLKELGDTIFNNSTQLFFRTRALTN